jgi:methionine biosynthesis protein MetW
MWMSNDSPDRHAQGLLQKAVDPLRYDGQSDDPHEVVGILRSFMPSGAHVLDVGCGTGSVTLLANRGKNNKVCGIEPDELRATVAKLRGIDVFCGRLTEEYLAEREKFDVILFADVLEHVAEPSRLLGLAAKGLKQDGIALISVPNVAHWSVRLDIMRGRFDYTDVGILDATHLRWFTSKTIQTLVRSQGFDIVAIKQTAGVDLPEHGGRRPWKWMPHRARRAIIRNLTRAMPLLFGCQHVVKARIRADLQK